MKKLLALFAILALLGAAFAQDMGATGHTPPPASGSDYADNSEGGNSASLTERVNISIPHRVALHLTQTELDLDLNNLGESMADAAGLDCFLVRKADIPAGEFSNYDTFVAAVSGYAVSNYPAVVFDGDGDVAMDGEEYLKGGLACSNTKIVQKFSNYLAGWRLTADVNIPTLSGIKFAIMDSVEHNPHYIADGDTSVCTFWFIKCWNYDGVYKYYVADTTLGFFNPLELDNSTLANQRLGRTNGWLDDHITEWFYFDGSEIAGDHTVTVQFTLTGGL
jgi:hypothetical protein